MSQQFIFVVAELSLTNLSWAKNCCSKSKQWTEENAKSEKMDSILFWVLTKWSQVKWSATAYRNSRVRIVNSRPKAFDGRSQSVCETTVKKESRSIVKSEKGRPITFFGLTWFPVSKLNGASVHFTIWWIFILPHIFSKTRFRGWWFFVTCLFNVNLAFFHMSFKLFKK